MFGVFLYSFFDFVPFGRFCFYFFEASYKLAPTIYKVYTSQVVSRISSINSTWTFQRCTRILLPAGNRIAYRRWYLYDFFFLDNWEGVPHPQYSEMGEDPGTDTFVYVIYHIYIYTYDAYV